MTASPTPKGLPSDAAPREAPSRQGVTWRAVVISLLIVGITAPAIFYGEVVYFRQSPHFWMGGWSSGVPAPWPLVVLFLLTGAVNLPFARRLKVTRPELLTIYSVVLVVTPLFGMHVLFYLLPKVPSYRYYGLTQPLWETTFLHLIPSWWGPTSPEAALNFHLGGAAVPWSEWLLPLAAWTSFMGCLYLANISLLVLVQKHWIQNERLTFPLAQLPLEAVGEGVGGGRGARLPVSKAFWVGMILAVVVGFLSQLSERLPAVPAVPMEITVMSPHYVGPMAALGHVQLWLYPWLIALAYILPKELSFSVWFLWLVRIGLCAVAIAYGHSPMPAEWWWSHQFPAPFNQATGAVIALAVWSLWTARRPLARAFRIAFRRDPVGGDRDEPMPYRAALLAFVISVAWLIAFLILSGNRPIFGFSYIILLIGMYLAYARLQAEGAFDPFFWWFNDMASIVVGMRNIRPAEVLTLYMMNWAGAPHPSRIFSSTSLNTLTSFKIADAAGLDKRRLTYLLFAIFAVALAIGMYITLTVLYGRGLLMTSAAKGNYFVPWALRDDGFTIFYDITSGGPPSRGVIYFGVGGITAILIGLMRLRFWWWPFHPIGYLLANSMLQSMGTFPFFIAWLLKTLVIRYGGLRLYRQTIPLAIGLIVGDLVNNSLWSFVGLATRGQL